MKKQTIKKLSLKKAQISKLDIKGGVHDAPIAWPKTCLGDACPFTMFFICPTAAAE